MANDVFIHVKQPSLEKSLVNVFDPEKKSGKFEAQACDVLITDDFDLFNTWQHHRKHHNQFHREVWQKKTLIFVTEFNCLGAMLMHLVTPMLI